MLSTGRTVLASGGADGEEKMAVDVDVHGGGQGREAAQDIGGPVSAR